MKNPPPACPETVSCFPFTLSFQRNKNLSRNRRSKPRSQTNLFIEYTIFRTGCRRHPNITSQITIRNPNCLRIRGNQDLSCFIHIRIKRFNLEREKAYATGTDAIHCCLIPLAGYYFFSVSPPFGLHGSGKIEPVKKSC